MPIIWRYLLGNYLKVLFFCLAAFIAILLTTRLDEIAHFASLGPDALFIVLFTLYQIPYIIPIALPISCLISAILLIQRLSNTHELTAMRASGMSLKAILAPIIIASLILSLCNFYMVSELATHSHLETGLLKSELRAVNPLLLLNNKHLMRLRGIFFNTLGPSKMGETAETVIVAMPSKHENGIHVMLADKLKSTSTSFLGEHLSLFTTTRQNKEEKDDVLIVENIGESKTSLRDFALMMQKRVWTLNNDHLQLPLLLAKLSEEKAALAAAESSQEDLKPHKMAVKRVYTEILRRFSVAFAAFSFTLMGAAFGINISRNKSNRGVAIVIALAALFLVAFFAAKSVEAQIEASAALYLLPHLLIIGLSVMMILKANKGIE